jgi:hypothetical protein
VSCFETVLRCKRGFWADHSVPQRAAHGTWRGDPCGRCVGWRVTESAVLVKEACGCRRKRCVADTDCQREGLYQSDSHLTGIDKPVKRTRLGGRKLVGVHQPAGVHKKWGSRVILICDGVDPYGRVPGRSNAARLYSLRNSVM